MTTKNWVYGAKSPDIEQAVSEAIFAAHRYRNKICELELAKRQRHEELLQRLAPEYVTACQAVVEVEAELAAAREAIQGERVKQRTRSPDGVQGYVDTAAQCKARLKELRANRKAAKQAAYTDPAVAAAMNENQQQHKAECKAAKDDSGLYWGTEAIVRQACASFASGSPPRFKRYKGEGQLAVQLQGGLDSSEATQADTRLQLIVPDDLQERLWQHGKAPRSLRKAHCLIRIGSDERKSPIFARVPIVFHRSLPPGQIKWAYLERRKLADQAKWFIRLTIDVPDSDRPRPAGTVAVHVGWRKESQGLRVATTLGSDGQYRYLRLSNDHLDDYERLDSIKSRRDNGFNEIRQRFAEWLAAHDHPEWIATEVKHMAKWKNPAKLVSIILRWREERFHGDGMFAELNHWRKSDKHLWQHECRLRKRVIRRRADLYRNFAKQLSEGYGTVVVAPIDAKRLVEHSDPEELERDQSARRAKQAAVSDLIRMIREKFPLHCVEVSAVGISETCANCGEKNRVKRKVQCRECRSTYDTDENAVSNTLARGEVAIKEGALLELLHAKEDAEQKKREKLAKMQAANRAARKRKREAVS